MSELKRCPCCPQGKGRMRTSHDEDGLLWVWIECDGCNLRTLGNWVRPENDCPQFRQERRDEWNRRQPQSVGDAWVKWKTGDALPECGKFYWCELGSNGLGVNQSNMYPVIPECFYTHTVKRYWSRALPDPYIESDGRHG